MDRLYPLAPSVWGAGEEIELENVVQAPLFAEFGTAKSSAFLPVLLHPNPLNGTWRVRRITADRSQGRVLGEVAKYHRDRFEEMRRVEASLLMPTTTAEIRFDNASGLFRATIILPPHQLAVPRNDPPEGARVLPPGDMMVVDTARGEFTTHELAVLSPGTWFVALHPLAGTVAATLGGKALGGFDADDAAELLSYLETAGTGGETPLYARAVLLGGMAALNAGHPAEGMQSIPALKVPDSTPTTPWTSIDFPDGTWAVTVERPFATDPQDQVRPRHTARYVSLTGVERPENLAASTQIFARVEAEEATPAPARTPTTHTTADAAEEAWEGAGDYLTEVQKVQLRRRRRVAGEVGRHRR